MDAQAAQLKTRRLCKTASQNPYNVGVPASLIAVDRFFLTPPHYFFRLHNP